MDVRTFDSWGDFVLYIEENLHGKFIVQNASADFGNDDWRERCAGKEVRWKGKGDETAICYDGCPFVVIGHKRYECAWGRQRSAKKGIQCSAGDHTYTTSGGKRPYSQIQTTKKMGCKAKFTVTEIVRFPMFSIESDNSALVHELPHVNAVCKFVCSVTSDCVHEGHVVGEMADVVVQMDKRIRSHINGLVVSGVRRLPEIRRHLQAFVEQQLFAGRDPPPSHMARYWPSSAAILNAMYRARTQLNDVDMPDRD